MRISRQTASAGKDADFEKEIRRIMATSGRAGRICGETCTIICNTCKSTSCQCMCHSDCPDAAARLSSDPDRFPIEPGIVPLVYAMAREATCTPCWSCEGHESPDGSLWKIPRVWFYCSSLVHPRLIGNGVHSLFLDRKTRAPWQVVITHSDPENVDTTFSLQPAITPDIDVSLDDLQADVRVIAAAWSHILKHEAKSLSDTVKSSQV